MPSKLTHLACFLFSGLLFPSLQASAQDGQKHLLVAMRMIGHELLLLEGDSTSRVLPIQQEGDEFTIQFEAELGLHPGKLVKTVEQVFDKSDIHGPYTVEVVQCDSLVVYYSYEMGPTGSKNLIPCAKREMPSSCYQVRITLRAQSEELGLWVNAPPDQSHPKSYMAGVLLTTGIFLLIGLFGFFHFKRQKPEDLPHRARIGAFVFDSNLNVLRISDKEIELTDKESELLTLLHRAANTTLKRDHLLKIVWGDEGAYIGRTLDVFISKLRKKLEADPNVKIVNVRGIGYKLITSLPAQ